MWAHQDTLLRNLRSQCRVQGLSSSHLSNHLPTAHVQFAATLRGARQSLPLHTAYANGHRRAPARDPERAAASLDDNDDIQRLSFAGALVTTKISL